MLKIIPKIVAIVTLTATPKPVLEHPVLTTFTTWQHVQHAPDVEWPTLRSTNSPLCLVPGKTGAIFCGPMLICSQPFFNFASECFHIFARHARSERPICCGEFMWSLQPSPKIAQLMDEVLRLREEDMPDFLVQVAQEEKAVIENMRALQHDVSEYRDPDHFKYQHDKSVKCVQNCREAFLPLQQLAYFFSAVGFNPNPPEFRNIFGTVPTAEAFSGVLTDREYYFFDGAAYDELIDGLRKNLIDGINRDSLTSVIPALEAFLQATHPLFLVSALDLGEVNPVGDLDPDRYKCWRLAWWALLVAKADASAEDAKRTTTQCYCPIFCQMPPWVWEYYPDPITPNPAWPNIVGYDQVDDGPQVHLSSAIFCILSRYVQQNGPVLFMPLLRGLLKSAVEVIWTEPADPETHDSLIKLIDAGFRTNPSRSTLPDASAPKPRVLPRYWLTGACPPPPSTFGSAPLSTSVPNPGPLSELD